MEKISEKELKEHLYVLILCGGGGTRLWPRSRQKSPKQFIDLFGEKTIFAQTVRRARALTSEEKIFIVTNANYVDEVYLQGKVPLRNILAEPQKRNTALAMAAGAAIIEKVDSKAVIINLASDHLVSPLNEFTQNMLTAAATAQTGDYLVTVGIKPTFPHIGFGYIRVSEELARIRERKIFKVKEFKEKPTLKTAKMFLRSGKYFWNANLYTWKAASFLAACRIHSPEVFRGIKKIQEAWGTKNEWKIINQVYLKAPSISVDYAVSEKAKNLVLIPASFTWSDVGDWEVVWEILPKDKKGNAVIGFGQNGEFYGVDSTDNLVQFSDQLVALVGVKDMIIIDTPDALLVCHKDRAEDVKKMVNLLKEKGKAEYL